MGKEKGVQPLVKCDTCENTTENSTLFTLYSATINDAGDKEITGYACITCMQSSGKAKTILKDAQSLIYGDRNKSYGHPRENMGLIAELWSSYKGVEISAMDVTMMMILVKVARQKNKFTRDNLIDIAGYAGVCERLTEE